MVQTLCADVGKAVAVGTADLGGKNCPVKMPVQTSVEGPVQTCSRGRARRSPVRSCFMSARGDSADKEAAAAYLTAEARARVVIDAQLAACGWQVQDRKDMNLYAGQGVAVREFIMAPGHGRADYVLFVDQKAVGAIEAKPSGTPLAGVEPQSAKYSTGLPKDLPTLVNPLPFLYASTGDETMFTDGFDPDPRSRSVLTFHRPETFARWLREIARQWVARVADLRPRCCRISRRVNASSRGRYGASTPERFGAAAGILTRVTSLADYQDWAAWAF